MRKLLSAWSGPTLRSSPKYTSILSQGICARSAASFANSEYKALGVEPQESATVKDPFSEVAEVAACTNSCAARLATASRLVSMRTSCCTISPEVPG